MGITLALRISPGVEMTLYWSCRQQCGTDFVLIEPYAKLRPRNKLSMTYVIIDLVSHSLTAMESEAKAVSPR